MAYALTQSFGQMIGSSMVSCLGLAPLAAVDLADEVALDFGLASLAVVEHCQSPSLFGMVISGHIGGCAAMGLDGLQISPHSLVASSGQSRKLAKSGGNCSASPRSSVRLNHTCFHIGLLGGHLTVDFCGEHECLSVCIRVISGWVRSTPSSRGSWCCCR